MAVILRTTAAQRGLAAIHLLIAVLLLFAHLTLGGHLPAPAVTALTGEFSPIRSHPVQLAKVAAKRRVLATRIERPPKREPTEVEKAIEVQQVLRRNGCTDLDTIRKVDAAVETAQWKRDAQ